MQRLLLDKKFQTHPKESSKTNGSIPVRSLSVSVHIWLFRNVQELLTWMGNKYVKNLWICIDEPPHAEEPVWLSFGERGIGKQSCCYLLNLDNNWLVIIVNKKFMAYAIWELEVLTGCKARPTRNFLIISASELKSRLTCQKMYVRPFSIRFKILKRCKNQNSHVTWTVQVRSIISSPREPTFGM